MNKEEVMLLTKDIVFIIGIIIIVCSINTVYIFSVISFDMIGIRFCIISLFILAINLLAKNKLSFLITNLLNNVIKINK